MKTLTNHKKKLIIAVLAMVILAIVSICFLKYGKVPNVGEPKIYRLVASFVIDYNDLREVVGDADYVFVGKVVSMDGTEYRDYVTVETEMGGTKEVGDPYTNYTVAITENIKGKLMMEKAIPIVKFGGVSEDGRECYLFEGDELPMEGNTYLFFAYAQLDGSLLISGPVSNVLVDNDESGRMSDDMITYEDVADAYQNQIDSGRERSVSIYEVGREQHTVGGECDAGHYFMEGTVLEKRDGSMLLVRVEEEMAGAELFDTNEVVLDCSNNRAVYENVWAGQKVSFSFFETAIGTNCVKVDRIYVVDEGEIYYFRRDFPIDYTDLNAVVGDADYVFVGGGVKRGDTYYKELVTVENETGELLEVNEPYTEYRVVVVENIKGNLKEGEFIFISKCGGVSDVSTACCLFEGDTLPEAGKRYIFFAYAQEDGSLLLRGPISNVPLEDGGHGADAKDGEALEKRDAITYEEVVEAYQNQIDSGRERFTSIYEAE